MPILGIHKNTLDFDVIETLDPKTIVLIDKSTYMDPNPDKPIVEVLIPGSSKPIIVPFNPYRTTIINAHQLNLSCGDNSNLPDGIYVLTYRICPQDLLYITKYYLKTDILEYELDNQLLTILNSTELTKAQRELFANIDIYISSAKAHAREGNLDEATSLYKRAQKEISKPKKCK